MKFVLAAIGAAMLGLGAYLISDTRAFVADAVPAEGRVIDLARSRSSDSTSYYPIVEFQTPDGTRIEFRGGVGSNPPSYTRGEAVKVLYQPAAPERARIHSTFALWGASIIVVILGVAFAGAGIGWWIAAHRRAKVVARLKDEGRPIFARVTGVERDERIKRGRRRPYRIHAQWQNPSTGKLHIFTSDAIWFDPTEFVTSDDIAVLIDPADPDQYFMDTSFLPEVA